MTSNADLEYLTLIQDLLALSDNSVKTLELAMTVNDYSDVPVVMIHRTFHSAKTTIEMLMDVLRLQTDQSFKLNDAIEKIVKNRQ